MWTKSQLSVNHGINSKLTFPIQHFTKEKKSLRGTRREHHVSGCIDVFRIASQIPSIPNQSNQEAKMRILIYCLGFCISHQQFRNMKSEFSTGMKSFWLTQQSLFSKDTSRVRQPQENISAFHLLKVSPLGTKQPKELSIIKWPQGKGKAAQVMWRWATRYTMWRWVTDI